MRVLLEGVPRGDVAGPVDLRRDGAARGDGARGGDQPHQGESGTSQGGQEVSCFLALMRPTLVQLETRPQHWQYFG